jgi:hypothetical protein
MCRSKGGFFNENPIPLKALIAEKVEIWEHGDVIK